MAFIFVCLITTPLKCCFAKAKRNNSTLQTTKQKHHQQLMFAPPILFVYRGGKEEVGVMCCKITIVELNIDF
jgi:hypothetical protein